MLFRTAFRPQACLFAILLGVLLPCRGTAQDAAAERIRAAIQAGTVDLAIGDARQALAQFPQSSELHQLLGVALFKKGLNAEAREALRRAVELDSKDPQNYYNLALVELSEKKYPEATRLLETAVKLDPGDALARVMLGRAYHNQNLTVPAIEQFKAALKLAPRVPLVHYHLGYAYQSQGNLPCGACGIRAGDQTQSGVLRALLSCRQYPTRPAQPRRCGRPFPKGDRRCDRRLCRHTTGWHAYCRNRGDFTGAEAELKRVIGLNPPCRGSLYARPAISAAGQ